MRWVDFIPEADVELKRQAPEASKALGAEVTFEFINANDLQPRITAAIQSGSGADIFQMLWNWPHLYANALVDVSDVAEPIGKAQGGFYDVFDASAKVNGRWLARSPRHRRQRHRLPPVVVHAEIGLKEFPKTWDEWREAGKKLKAKGKPVGQALGHSFGDPPTFAYPLLWTSAAPRSTRAARRSSSTARARLESVKFMQAFWKDACDEGGLAWDDTNNNRAFHAGELSATLNGASIYIVAKRQKDKIKDDKGEPLWQDIEHAALLPEGPAGQFALYGAFQHCGHEVLEEPEAGQGLPKWLHQKENYGKWFEVNEGYSVGAPRCGKSTRCGPRSTSRCRSSAGPRGNADARPPGPGHGQGHRGLYEVHHRRHVRQGRPGHQGRGRGEVGRGRAQEDLRRMTVRDPKGGPMKRRTFLKVTGIAGILAAHRAPAFAQGTKLHILRWVDFIPACDVELKRQAGEASKALGAEVQFEFINANDLQPRITAAIQSQSGPDIVHMLHNWPHLYENGLRRGQRPGRVAGQGAGRLLRAVGGVHEGGQPVHGPAPQHRPGLIAYRKSWFDEVGATTSPKTLRGLRQVGMKLKKKGHPLGQTLGHTFGDAPAWAYPAAVELRRDGDRQERQDGARQQGIGGGREVHDRPSGRTPATRAAWPGTTPTTTAPSWPARSAPR